ncbi:putative ATP-grasp superfamily ATP-dependent carboligase [Jiangella mangrovi]|uniref:Putative ATP-grasp superfamily ATP-dependent carboligase n=1 Tax=Jiangella mangrovi TaxID=1524084 RepID=A0A7W9GSN8_9ACTN|nr:putative ATP-grasp superfamily ATP-dependent carboligase [Jiangella mangrovi]
MMEIDGAPQLRNPVLIAAFEGWNDAGEAATAGVEHLERVWNGESVAALDPDEYYDFQVNRPLVSVDEDAVRSIEWPTTRLSVASLDDRDIVLLRGIEPNMRWRAFCAELLSVAADLGCEQVITLGALLADVPHTRPVPVTVSASDPDQAERLGLEPSRYEGPTGIVGVFQDAATKAGLDSVSLWAAVPHYVAQSPCPKATLVLLQRVEDHLGLPIPMGDLAEQAEAWQHGVDELAEEDSDVAEYVRRLEEARDTVDLPEASGEHIAREFERYLRRRDT